MSKTTNLFFSYPRTNRLIPGLRVEPIKRGANAFPTPCVVLGSAHNGRLIKGSAAIPLDFSNPPELGNEKVFAGSFGEVPNSGLNLTALNADEPGVSFVLVRTGFIFTDGGVMGDLGRMQQAFRAEGKEPKLCNHGSVALHAAAQQMLLTAHSGAQVDEVDLPKAEAQAVKTVVGYRPGLGMPAYVYRLWKMPDDSALLVRDVSGFIYRIVNEKRRTDMVDATGQHYHDMFEMLLGEQQKPRFILPAAA